MIIFQKLRQRVYEILTRSNLRNSLATIETIAKLRYVDHLLSDQKYQNPKRLERFGRKVYSQNDEDGIIAEIFHRIGFSNKKFVEFGVEDGLESCSIYLLHHGWSGLWIDGSDENVSKIRRVFEKEIAEKRLFAEASFITAENINASIKKYFYGEIDLLSIDIDGNDLHVLEAINIITPRVLIMEYNGKLPPPISVTSKYYPDFVWDHSDYGGASLEAITRVASRKGYSLVCCCMAGVNAFFVRNDLTKDLFDSPFTAENHFQPARVFLSPLPSGGHRAGWGEWTEVT